MEKTTNRIIALVLSWALLALAGCNSPHTTTTAPSPPDGVVATVTGIGEVTLRWDALPNASSYTIYWSTIPGVTKTYATPISSITSTSFVHSGLYDNTPYYYVVTASNSYGESNVSAEVSVKLQTPLAPTNLSAVAGNASITLNWNSFSEATVFNLYWASAPGVTPANGAKIAGLPSASYLHSGLVNGSLYYYVVTAENAYGESAASTEVAQMPAAIATDTITVSGRVQYEDKLYNTAGFTGTAPKAVRFTDIEVVDSSNGNSVLASGLTDSAGYYSLSFAKTSSPVYVRIISSANPPSSISLPSTLAVKNLSNSLYAVPSSNFVPSGNAAVNIVIFAAGQVSGPFNILDVYTSAFEFVNSLGKNPPSLDVYWEVGSWDGTYYCSAGCSPGNGIFVLGGDDSYGNGDTDQFDDDVLWHEFGHFLADKFSRDESPGGYHFLNINDQDMRLSWSEGWGNFYQGAIKKWFSTNDPSLLSSGSPVYYVDTFGDAPPPIQFNFENPGGAPYIYATCETAVAKALLDVRNVFGMQAIWDIFDSAAFIQPATPLDKRLPANLELFWDNWLLRSTASQEMPTLQSILNSAGNLSLHIDYSLDSFETTTVGDNTPNAQRKLAVGGGEVHTLYPADDLDFVAFDADGVKSYTIRASALKNGADTYIRLIGQDTTSVLASNDNTSGYSYFAPFNFYNNVYHENGNDLLGSTITTGVLAAGTYYVEITSTPYYDLSSGTSIKPLSAGRYGTYTLAITSL